MRALWVDENNDLDYTRARAWGIQDAYFSLKDPRVTKTYLAQVKAQGFRPGVYAAWNWGTWSGAEFAEWVHEKLKPLQVSQNNPLVHLDIETHDVLWILQALQTYRRLRPSKATGWTLESHQGGLFSAAQVAAIKAQNLDILPQAYTGSMVRQESDRVVLDLVLRGFDPKRIWCFLDAAQVGNWWGGVLYTQGRLPPQP